MKFSFRLSLLFSFLIFSWSLLAQNSSFETAKQHFENQQYDQAISLLEKLIVSGGANPEAYEIIIRCYADQGWGLKMNGQEGSPYLTKAVAYGQEFIKNYPKSFLAYRSLGYAYHYNQLFAEAKSAYEAALQLNPLDAQTYFLLWTVSTEETSKKLESPLIKKALELDPTLAEAWQRLGDFYKELQQYEKAIAHYEKAASIRPNYILHYSLGSLYAQQGDLDAAAKQYNAAISMQQDFAYAHYGLATVYLAQENMDMAVKEINLAIKFNPAVYEYYEALLPHYPNLARYSIKKPKEKAIENSQDQQSGVPAHYSEAIELAQKKNYAKAVTLFNLALEKEQAKSLPNNGYIVSMFNWKMHCYFQLGNYSDAIQIAKESIPYTETYGLRQDVASLYATIAAIYNDWGSSSEAIAFTEKSIDILRELKLLQNEALAFSNLCEIYRSAGNYTKSIEYGFKAAELNKQLSNATLEAQSYNSLARSFLKKHLPEKAQEMVDAGFQRILNRDEPAMHAELNLTQAEILNAQAKFKEALRFFEKANTYFSEHSNVLHLSYRRILKTKAMIYINNNNLKAAEEAFLLLFYVIDFRIKDYFPSLSDEGKSRFFRTLKEDYEIYSNFVRLHHKKNPQLITKMYESQLRIKSLMINTSQKLKHKILKGSDEDLKKLFNEWQDKRNALAKLYVADHGTNSNEEVKYLATNIQELEIQLGKKSRDFSALTSQRFDTWTDIAKTISTDQAIIEFVRFRDFDFRFDNSFGDSVRYSALILSGKTKSIDMVMLNNGNELEGRAFNFYINSIQLRTDDTKSYDAFFRPLEQKLNGVKTVYVCPDGIFYKINFNTLFNPRDGKYSAEKFTIRLLTNSRDVLQHVASHKQQENRAVLVGFPNYKSTSVDTASAAVNVYSQEPTQGSNLAATKLRGSFQGIDDLPGTLDEIQSIKSILQPAGWHVATYLQNNAREETIKSQTDPDILHIATHGYFEQTDSLNNPLLGSGLLLAGAAATNLVGAEDGVLTAYEAMNLNLDETQLVILSACETGKGVIHNGEGIYGLQSAFKVAGAKNVIMSLWKVDDRATQKLMTLFYKSYIETRNIHTSFSAAQLTLRKEYSAPFYWGAFILIGL